MKRESNEMKNQGKDKTRINPARAEIHREEWVRNKGVFSGWVDGIGADEKAEALQGPG